MHVSSVSIQDGALWCLRYTLREGGLLRKWDMIADPNDRLWAVQRMFEDEQGLGVNVYPHFIREVVDDKFLPLPEGAEGDPVVGEYTNRTCIDAETARFAAGWWADRLRGKEDIPTLLHEYDVNQRFPEPVRGIMENLQGRLKRIPIPEEKIAAFEADLLEWMLTRFFQPYNAQTKYRSCWDLRTDYEPIWPPLHGLTQKHGLPTHRFPTKTLMLVYPNAVVVNDVCIHGEVPKDARWARAQARLADGVPFIA